MENTSINEVLKSLESGYLEGSYDQVIEQLVKSKDSFSVGEFHYNLGTVLLKKGDLAAGRYNLELAKSKGYTSPKLENNIKYVKEKLSVSDISASKKIKDQSLEAFLTTPISLISTFCLVIILISITSLRLKLIKKYAVAIIPILFSLLILLTSYGIKNSYTPIITLENISIHEGPSAVYDQVGSIPGGAKIILSEESKDWVFVKYPENFAGWIKKEKLGYVR